MISKKQYIDAVELIEAYERQEFEISKLVVSKINISTLSKEEWGVHESHCCFKHGCKYGNDQCPVALGVIEQKYPCETCGLINEGFFGDERQERFPLL